MLNSLTLRTCFLKTNFIFGKLILFFFKKVLGCGFFRCKVVHCFDVEIEIPSLNLYPLILFLNRHSLCLFTSIMDIACSDRPGNRYRYSLNYNLISSMFNTRLRLITKVIENDTKLLSIVSLFRSVNWSEREVFDFFGIFFFQNVDLRRILTDYGFYGFPLRKDFPLSGFIDLYYDDNVKKICYRNLSLNQEYRNFNFSCNWH